MSTQTHTTEIEFSTIAVLLSGQLSQPGSIVTKQQIITGQQLNNVLKRPHSIGELPSGGMSITSSRDQIEIQMLPNKIDVRDLSGELGHAKEEVPRVLHEFFALLSDPTIFSFGINFILVCPVENPKEWLGQNLLKSNLEELLNQQPTSNAISISLRRPPKTINVSFRPGERASINVNFNSSEEATELPPREALESQMQMQYEELLAMLQGLGLYQE